jgi:hypothetical protein
MSIPSICIRPIADNFAGEKDDTPSSPKTIDEFKQENLFLRIENRTLMHNVMEQQKEIMRLQNVILEQNKEFQTVLTDMNARQIRLEEKMTATETKSKYAIAGTAIAVACAIIGGTCGFSNAYKIVGRFLASSLSEDSVEYAAGAANVLLVRA